MNGVYEKTLWRSLSDGVEVGLCRRAESTMFGCGWESEKRMFGD